MCDSLSTFLQDKAFAGRILSAWNKLFVNSTTRWGTSDELEIFPSAKQIQQTTKHSVS